MPSLKDLTKDHPVTGVLSLVGVILAWIIFSIALVAVSIVRRDIYISATASQQMSFGLGLLAICASMGLAVVTTILGLFGTIQKEQSRITGIIGLIGSFLLLVSGLFWFISLISR